jgi:alcohol dehydrogenase
MITRHVWFVERPGSLDRLARRTQSMAEPGSGEARVDVKAIGLNFADVFACLGLYSATPRGAFVPGLEFAGVVEAVGPDTRYVQIGQRVLGLTRFGAFSTRINADERYLRLLPDGWSFAEGAAFQVQALTAWYAVYELGAARDHIVTLLHSAAGGVGLAALPMLRRVDASVVATVGHEEKRSFLIDRMGFAPETVIVRDRRRFGSQLDAALEALGGEGFDLVLDAVGGPYFKPAYARLRRGGRYVMFGAADMMPHGPRPNWLRLAWQYAFRPRLDPLQMISENRSVMGFNLIWLWNDVDRLAPAWRELARFSDSPPYVGRVFSFDEAPAALRWLQSGSSIGKVVIEV